jgi:DNA mismatch repair protein MutS2
MAILERLRGYGSRVIATTHYGELKIYALETSGVQNASCEFDVATLRPTYRLNIGLPGRSNALLIGEKLGLDMDLLASARRNMNADDRRFEDVLNEIELLKAEISRREQQVEQTRLEADELLKSAKVEYGRMVAEGKRDMDVAKLKAKQLSADITANANKLLDELRKIEQDKEHDVKSARQRARAIAHNESAKLHDLAGSEIESAADQLEPVSGVRQGDAVYVVALAQIGTALGDADEKGMVEIQAGSIKTRVHLKDLRKPQQSATPKKPRTSLPKVSPQGRRSGHNEINLLGLTVDEAVLETERFIDGAILSHLNTLYIIHGKGTGALRSAIHGLLKSNKHVKNFRLGGYGEGESGVTIAELK